MFSKNLKSIIYLFLVSFLVFSMPDFSMAQDNICNSLNRDVQILVKLTNSSKQTASAIHVTLPLISADSQYQQTIAETFNQDVEKIVVGESGSRTAHILIDSLAPGQSKTIIVDYKLNIVPGGGLSAASNSELAQYLKPSDKIESDNPEIIATAAKLTASVQGEIAKIHQLADFVNSHISYDLHSSYKNKGALSALHNQEGVCEDYAALFVALSRAAGIPARQVNGFADPKLTGTSWKSCESTISLRGYRHAWAEAYIENKGWVAVDPTFKLYPQNDMNLATALSPSHIAQNYYDQPVKVSYRGKNISVGWGNLLVNK